MTQKTENNIITDAIKMHRAAVDETFTDASLKQLEIIVGMFVKAISSGNKILLCGNGGSAADSQHIAAEFVGRFKRARKSLPAIALTTDTSVLTCIANDYSYEAIFERQVEGIGQKGDLLVAISTSGNSENVIRAAKKAKEMGISVVGLTGRGGGALKAATDINFEASSDRTSHIQEMHITVLHAVSEAAESQIIPE